VFNERCFVCQCRHFILIKQHQVVFFNIKAKFLLKYTLTCVITTVIPEFLPTLKIMRNSIKRRFLNIKLGLFLGPCFTDGKTLSCIQKKQHSLRKCKQTKVNRKENDLQWDGCGRYHYNRKNRMFFVPCCMYTKV
jgi:hypothetical protein